MSWLITSAIASEIDTLKAFVAKASEESGLVKGRIHKIPVTLASLGIGSVDAAITLTRLLSATHFDKVYFVGTAGILPGTKFELNQAVEVARVLPARVEGERLIGAQVDNIVCELAPEEGGVNAWSSAGVSETRQLAEHAAKYAAHVENLELWGVARTCKRFEVPMGAVLGLSNRVGAQAGEEWKAHKDSAAAAACQLLAGILEKAS